MLFIRFKKARILLLSIVFGTCTASNLGWAQTSPNVIFKITSTLSDSSATPQEVVTSNFVASEDGSTSTVTSVDNPALVEPSFRFMTRTIGVEAWVRADLVGTFQPVTAILSAVGPATAQAPAGGQAIARACFNTGCNTNVPADEPDRVVVIRNAVNSGTQTLTGRTTRSLVGSAGVVSAAPSSEYSGSYRKINNLLANSFEFSVRIGCPRGGGWGCQGDLPSSSSGSISAALNFQILLNPPSTEKRPGDDRGGIRHKISCDGGNGGDGGGAISGDSDRSDEQFQGTLNASTGNFSFRIEDPVVTRTTPLKNVITIQNQNTHTSGPFGSASFTYGMKVITSAQSGGPKPNRWYVIDGDGEAIDFGAGSTPAAQPGVFSNLVQLSGGGYELQNAGEFESARERGDYLYVFDSAGVLQSMTDPAGNQQTLQYSGSGELQTVTDISTGRQLTFSWTSGRVTQVTENSGPKTVLTYETVGGSQRISSLSLQTSASVEAKRLNFNYYTNGLLYRIIKDSDAESAIKLTYATIGGVAFASVTGAKTNYSPTYFLPPTTGVSGSVTRTVLRNAKNGSISYDLNSNTDVIRADYGTLSGASAPYVVTYGYDSNRNRNFVTDGATSVSTTYNSFGLPLQISRSGGSTKTLTWSGAKLTSIADSIGSIATFQYNDSAHPNLPSSYTDALSNVWAFGRNAYGQLISMTNPIGSAMGATTLEYEETSGSANLGLLKRISNALNHDIQFSDFTPQGYPQQTSVDSDLATPLTRDVTSYTYDAAGRRVLTTHPDGKTITNTYTGRKLSSVTDEANTTTSFGYCAGCGLLQSVASPLGHNLANEIDNDRDMTDFVDARTNTTSYSYGTARELTSILYPDLSVEVFQYDANARLASALNARNQQISYTYDSSGRLYQTVFPTTSETTQTFNYRADDLPDSFTDEAGTTTYDYYANRLLKSITYNYSSSGLTNTQKVEYEYYPDNLLKKVTYKNGTTPSGTWFYTYDLAGRMKSVASFGFTDSYTYDDEGKIIRLDYGNGTNIAYTWNNARSFLSSIIHRKGTLSPFGSFTMEYDGGANTVGNLTTTTESSGDSITYGYDALYRLTSEARTGTSAYTNSYGYDLAGNLTTVNSAAFAAYDSANKISTLTGGSIAHDLDGNVTTVTGASIPATTLAWNARSKPSSITANGVTKSYKYDALGHRVVEQSSTGSRFFIFSGDLLLAEVDNNGPQVAYTWGADGLVSERIFTNLSSQPGSLDGEFSEDLMIGDDEDGGMATDAITPRTEHTLWYHFGPQGETRYMTSNTGAVVNWYLYDAYGKIITAIEPHFNAHEYGGKYGYYSNGNAAGLVLAGARWYSPQLRRWISRDPIHYKGGENLFGYVNQNPVNFVDPNGTEATVITIGTVLEIGAVAGASGPATLLIGGTAIVGGVYCLLNPDKCKAALQGCVDRLRGLVNPNLFNKDERKRIEYLAGEVLGHRPSPEELEKVHREKEYYVVPGGDKKNGERRRNPSLSDKDLKELIKDVLGK